MPELTMEFPEVDQPEWSVNIKKPVLTEKQKSAFQAAVHKEELRRTRWSVLPASFASIMKALYPDCKSPMTIPDRNWIESCAVYEAHHLLCYSSEWWDCQQVAQSSEEGKRLFWGGDSETLLLVQLTAVKQRLQLREALNEQS